MRKIVLLSQATQADSTLLGLLELLFPQCDIEVVSVQDMSANDSPDGVKKPRNCPHA